MLTWSQSSQHSFHTKHQYKLYFIEDIEAERGVTYSKLLSQWETGIKPTDVEVLWVDRKTDIDIQLYIPEPHVCMGHSRVKERESLKHKTTVAQR